MIVCDSSSIISLVTTCNGGVFKYLKQYEFVIPPQVEEEIISNPLKIPQHQHSAVIMQLAVKKEWLKKVNAKELKQKTEEVMQASNNLFIVDGKPLTLIQEGEAACMALMRLTGAKLFLVDEKTTRMLIESPMTLKKIIEEEYKSKAIVNQKSLSFIEDLTKKLVVMRSTELLAVAAKNGFFTDFEELEEKAFHSALYALRFAGCSISGDELQDYDEFDLSKPSRTF